MGRFFAKRPQAGLPLSVRGLAEGLAAIETALDGMSIVGGYIQWSNGRLIIVPGITTNDVVELVCLRYATAADVDDNPTWVEGQPLQVTVRVPASAVISTIACTPNVHPEVVTE